MVDELGTSMLSIRHKIVFIGDPNTGKTSFMHRLINNTFKEEYESTIGVDFYTKTIKYNETIFKLQLWDTAGQEKYKALIPSYIRGASIIFILYDITNQSSFDSIGKWLSFVKGEIDVKNTKLVLIGNKSDLQASRKVTKEAGEKLAKEENILFYEMSVKTTEGLNEAFYNAIALLDFFEEYNKNDKLITDLIEQNMEADEVGVDYTPSSSTSKGMKVDNKSSDNTLSKFSFLNSQNCN